MQSASLPVVQMWSVSFQQHCWSAGIQSSLACIHSATRGVNFLPPAKCVKPKTKRAKLCTSFWISWVAALEAHLCRHTDNWCFGFFLSFGFLPSFFLSFSPFSYCREQQNLEVYCTMEQMARDFRTVSKCSLQWTKKVNCTELQLDSIPIPINLLEFIGKSL